jgi:hypothetical protein
MMRSCGIRFDDLRTERFPGVVLVSEGGIAAVTYGDSSPQSRIDHLHQHDFAPAKPCDAANAAIVLRDCNDVVERFKDKSFEDMVAAFGPPIEDRAATATTGRILVFGNVTKTIQSIVVLELPKGKFEFRFQAAKASDDDTVA